ncbi:MAG: LysR family transcriptional regulator [Rhodocyclaceae bacterium]|nr:LysR family transcriptional regulator [Rhodocyclaceae bacterium]
MPPNRPLSTFRISPFDLRLFSTVAEAGSITGGARHLHMSLAAASTRLQRLEHALGTELLRRSKAGVGLTDAGRALLRHAGRVERELETLHAEMAAYAHGIRSTVRVICNTAAMSEYLPPLIGRFLADNEDVDIDLRELDSQDVLSAMRREQADIGIVADYVGTEGLDTRIFREDRLVAVLPARDPPPTGEELRFVELLDRPFVGLPAESGLSRFLQGRALHCGRGLHHRVRVRSLDAVVGLVADGTGVAVVPEAAARRLADDRVVVRPLADDWARRRLLLCTAGGRPPEGRAAELLGFLAAESPAIAGNCDVAAWRQE